MSNIRTVNIYLRFDNISSSSQSHPRIIHPFSLFHLLFYKVFQNHLVDHFEGFYANMGQLHPA